MSQGKRGESSQWIKDYLKSQNVDISSWEEYGPLYIRYSARIRKYKPQNYAQFINLCTFSKQRKKRCGVKDLGDWSRELEYQTHRDPKEPKEPKPKSSGTYKPTFNEERYLRDERRNYNDYKARMKRYREDKIRNLTQQGETGKLKDRMPYLFLLAIRCLSGRLPEECFPEALSDYREELQNILDEQGRIFKELGKEKVND